MGYTWGQAFLSCAALSIIPTPTRPTGGQEWDPVTLQLIPRYPKNIPRFSHLNDPPNLHRMNFFFFNERGGRRSLLPTYEHFDYLIWAPKNNVKSWYRVKSVLELAKDEVDCRKKKSKHWLKKDNKYFYSTLIKEDFFLRINLFVIR